MKQPARRMLRTAPVVAAMAVAVAAIAVAPAPAYAGGGVVMTSGQSGPHLFTATLTVNVAPATGGDVAFVYNCQAEATPDSFATTISTCSVGSSEAPYTDIPGDVAAIGGAGLAPSGLQVQACIAGAASFLEGKLGDPDVAGPPRCVTVTLSVGVTSATVPL